MSSIGQREKDEIATALEVWEALQKDEIETALNLWETRQTAQLERASLLGERASLRAEVKKKKLDIIELLDDGEKTAASSADTKSSGSRKGTPDNVNHRFIMALGKLNKSLSEENKLLRAKLQAVRMAVLDDDSESDLEPDADSEVKADSAADPNL